MDWKLIALEDGEARELEMPPRGYPQTVGSIIGDWRVVWVEPCETGGYVYLARDHRQDAETG